MARYTWPAPSTALLSTNVKVPVDNLACSSLGSVFSQCRHPVALAEFLTPASLIFGHGLLEYGKSSFQDEEWLPR